MSNNDKKYERRSNILLVIMYLLMGITLLVAVTSMRSFDLDFREMALKIIVGLMIILLIPTLMLVTLKENK